MTFLKVLLIILLALWLISLIRLGGRVSYGQAGLFVTVLAGPIKIRILPAKPKKKKKPKKEKKTKEKEQPKPPVAEAHEKAPKESRPSALSRLMEMAPEIGQACGALKRKIRIDDLKLQLIWGGRDPAAIALGYGKANAVLGILWPIFDNNFKVKRSDFQIGMDYDRTQPAVELGATVTFTVGQAVVLFVRYGVKILLVAKKGRSHKTQEA